MPVFLRLFLPMLWALLLLCRTASATPVGAEEQARIAHAFLLEQAQALAGDAQVVIDTRRIREQASCPEIQAFLPSGQQLRARMSVGLRCLSSPHWVSSVPASLSIMSYYYVSNRSIQAGETLSMDDFQGREGDRLRLPASVIFDPGHIVGYIAKQRIASGSTIRSTALRNPDAIVRGQTVRTIARGLGFMISSEGQAMQDGSPGMQIQVRASSGQIISATVLNASTVQVLM